MTASDGPTCAASLPVPFPVGLVVGVSGVVGGEDLLDAVAVAGRFLGRQAFTEHGLHQAMDLEAVVRVVHARERIPVEMPDRSPQSYLVGNGGAKLGGNAGRESTHRQELHGNRLPPKNAHNSSSCRASGASSVSFSNAMRQVAATDFG